MIILSKKWSEYLSSQPETGMGYQVAKVILQDGTVHPQVMIVEGNITKVQGYDMIPFSEVDIKEIILTHDKFHLDHAKQ